MKRIKEGPGSVAEPPMVDRLITRGVNRGGSNNDLRNTQWCVWSNLRELIHTNIHGSVFTLHPGRHVVVLSGKRVIPPVEISSVQGHSHSDGSSPPSKGLLQFWLADRGSPGINLQEVVIIERLDIWRSFASSPVAFTTRWPGQMSEWPPLTSMEPLA